MSGARWRRPPRRKRFQLGGEERHAAVVFVDIIGSTKLVTGLPATEVVALLNRFFAVVVDEVDRHDGLLNKFEGDACLAVFGAPNDLEHPEDAALAAARGIADAVARRGARMRGGYRGGRRYGGRGQRRRPRTLRVHRDRRTGQRGGAAVRAGEDRSPSRLLASSDTVRGATETESAHWTFGDTVTLRGHDEPTLLAFPTSSAAVLGVIQARAAATASSRLVNSTASN